MPQPQSQTSRLAAAEWRAISEGRDEMGITRMLISARDQEKVTRGMSAERCSSTTRSRGVVGTAFPGTGTAVAVPVAS